MSTANTIVLRGSLADKAMEFPAGEALIYPGMLIESYNASGTSKVRKPTVYGARMEPLFAKEDSYQGKTIDDVYTVGDCVFAHRAQPGDAINARLPAGAVAVSIDDILISNGDGTLVKSQGDEEELLYNSTAASAAITNTVTETAFDKSYTIPANTLKAGDVIKISAQGICTSTNSTDTLTVKAYIGSTQLATTGAVDVANNDIFDVQLTVVVRTIGASGTFIATGTVALGASGTVTQKAVFVASTTVDTTAAQALTIKGTWSVASASNSVRLDQLTVEKNQQVGAGGYGVIGKSEEAVDNSAGVTSAFCAVRILA